MGSLVDDSTNEGRNPSKIKLNRIVEIKTCTAENLKELFTISNLIAR
jgi:hypothetical protein